jgi:2'-5' RNA ligase
LKAHAAEPTQRLFFALWPSAEEQRALAQAAHKAARYSGGRATPEEKLHLTLVFLGSVPQRRLPELAQIDLVLTTFGRSNSGTVRGDARLADRFLNLFYRI